MEKGLDPTLLDFVVGDFTIISSRNLIIKGTEELAITPKMLQVLIELAKHQGETLTKEQLLTAVWGTIHTSDMVLSRAISDLRKVFGDSAKEQKYIETVSKQGYRLKQPVKWSSKKLSENRFNRGLSVQYKRLNNKKRVGLWSVAIGIVALLLYVSASFKYESNDISSKPDEAILIKSSYLTSSENTKRFVRVKGNYVAFSSSKIGVPGNSIKLISLTEESKKIHVVYDQKTKDESISVSSAPAFSPDGSKIAYKHFSSAGCFILISDIKTNTHKELAECPSSKTDALDWSSDGTRLVTTVFDHFKKIEGLALVDISTGDMEIVALPESKASGYLWPRFSPKANKIATVYFQPNRNLWTIGYYNLLSREFEEVLELGDEVSQVVWDESGTFIYYLLVGGTKAGIWRVNIESRDSAYLVSTDSSSLDYDILRKQFVVIERERKYGVWATEKSEQSQVSTSRLIKSLPQTQFPSLSENEDNLAFISSSKGIHSLWSKDLKSNNLTLLFQAKPSESLFEPSWSPDGKKLMVTVLAKDSSSIVEFDLTLGTTAKFKSNANVKMGKWSPDGLSIFWYEQQQDGWHVMQKELNTGKISKILSQPISRFDVKDNQYIYYQKIGSFKVQAKMLDSSKSESSETLVLDLAGSFEWHLHKDFVYYTGISPDRKSNSLYRKSFIDGETSHLYPIKVIGSVDTGRHLSVNKDGNNAYHTKLHHYQTDVALIQVSND